MFPVLYSFGLLPGLFAWPAAGDPAPEGDPVEVLALVSDFEVS